MAVTPGASRMGSLRYLVPNALTSMSVAFGLLSIQAALAGTYRTAAWWAMYCVLTDKLDGLAARALKASSAFGAQLDSFADFLSFGVAPATIIVGFFASRADLGWTEGWRAIALPILGLSYVIAVAARLARFNVTLGLPGSERLFFGVPTTFAGGAVCACFAMGLKYGDPAWSAGDPTTSWDVALLGGARLDAMMPWVPLTLPVWGALMVSTLRVPKVGRTGRGWLDVLQLACALSGLGLGMARMTPEYLFGGGLSYVLVSIYFHLTSPTARAARLPPLFGPTGQ